MDIRLQILEHQTRALSAVSSVFKDVPLSNGDSFGSNPLFDIGNHKLIENITNIQEGKLYNIDAIPKNMRTKVDDGTFGIDIKMETGTGKTYVYTRMMYELHKEYGFSKFIILVPSTPIKEGTKAFLTADYAKKHFADIYGSDVKLYVDVLDPQKKKKGRKLFPSSIYNFVSASLLQKNRLNCLLMTDGMLLSKATMDTTYDQMVLGSSSNPYEAIARTRPIVIIDEPHRFRRENKAYKRILEKLNPLAIIRFGATFPKNSKSKKTDYNNLVFSLGAVEAFNEQLVKGIAIQYPENTNENDTLLKVMSISRTKPKNVVFRDEKTGKKHTLGLNESLSEINKDFYGIGIDGIGKTENTAIKTGVTLSNGQILAVGDKISSAIYSKSYQSLMISQAIDNHFRSELENFRRGNKIKIVSLFFIDSIFSYRGEDGEKGHLRLDFEEELKNKINKFIEKEKLDESKNEVDKEYYQYLQATLADLGATNGGYFSEDNSSSDEEIKAEVGSILRDKIKLLSFKNENGTWNTMRFIFSKWTLREGWDNPNVFQIVKLRSSGSEISKLQEVGRGLRLPVDENGNRISGEQFYLNYLIDYSEKDFARQLISEVNSDIYNKVINIKSLLDKVASDRGLGANQLFGELLVKAIIDYEGNVIDGKSDELFNLYPEFNVGVKADKIKDNQKSHRVGVRRNRYLELKELWELVNKKYYLQLDELSEDEIEQCIYEILESGIYKKQQGSISQEKTAVENDELVLLRETVARYDIDASIPYGKWLKSVYKSTKLPIVMIHRALAKKYKSKTIPKDFFSKDTADAFARAFYEWMQKKFLQKFSYIPLDIPNGATALTNANGEPIKDIVQGNIGIYRDDSYAVPDKFLFDTFVYDSPKEKLNIEHSNLESITVFGKIPRRSIKVPLYFGGTTSPDFMYVLEDKNGNKSLNFIIETKDVETTTMLRGEENYRIKSAERFFETMKSEGVNIEFTKQLKNDDIKSMIDDLLSVQK